MGNEQQYLSQLQYILDNGERAEDRTGTGTLSVFGMQARYDLSEGFPLFTTKRVFWKAVVGELLWFLDGSTNRDRLEEITFGTIGSNSTIWDEWADEAGDLGPVYGEQWRNWDFGFGVCDQIQYLIDDIKINPNSRRHVVSSWNTHRIDDMALPPCHTLWQVKITGERMDLQLYQRSADMFLGVPFNVASYSLLLRMIAQVTGYKAGYFIHSIGDAHIYLNHIDQVKEQLTRDAKRLPAVGFKFPTPKSIFDFSMDDIILDGYDPHPAIKAPVAV